MMKFLYSCASFLGCSILLSSFYNEQPARKTGLSFPYKQTGMTERQAAAHLLSRFTYGSTPGQVEEVLKTGLEKWFQQQLDAQLPDDSLTRLLSQYDALKLSNSEILNTYLNDGQTLRMAIKEGYIPKDSVNKADKKAYRDALQSYRQQKGLKPKQELFRQFINQKILRAAYSRNQLQEVLTDFWFNHFNVSITKNNCAAFIPAYERDVIRPNVTGKFANLLLATAKSPAMLYFLDNFNSSAESKKQPMRMASQKTGDSLQGPKLQKVKKAQGLNENYAREVMELHTLGVDGEYTQQDVTQAARILTGWSVYPMKNNSKGNFLFIPNRHDQEAKKVLNVPFAAGGGYQEGVKLLNMLAHHPSTAGFITRKLAVRFVSDHPQQSLLDKMSDTFTKTDGDIRQVLTTLVSAPEFWSTEALREKTKSPFELAISAVRSLHAEIRQPYQLYNWVNKMGQKIYYYQAPTGFPDKAQYWINTGALLNRMNFGLALTSQRIPGIRINLAALNNHQEPESSKTALTIYSKLIMPERSLEGTIIRLTPMLNNSELISTANTAPDNNSMLAQVVGMIIGSPEFQRR